MALNNWNYLSNGDGQNPSRILIGWNKATCNITIVHTSQQWLTCEVSTPSNSSPYRITFIYGYNSPAKRLGLWSYISHHSITFSSKPWLLMSDFNVVMERSDRNRGNTTWLGYQNDFGNCMRATELMQVPYTGLRHTWHNGRAVGTIQKKLDWSFGNAALFTK